MDGGDVGVVRAEGRLAHDDVEGQGDALAAPQVAGGTQLAKKVSQEAHRLNQFLRFQKAADGTYFAAVEPLYDVLSLSVRYLRDRFADQVWLVYDLKREYGYYYDGKEVREVRFEHPAAHLQTGKLDET